MNLEQLYTEHYKSVYYTCYKYLQNEEDAKDMAQNVFIKAFDKIDSLKDTSSFKSWINRIAANECLNELKKTNRIKLEELTATNSDGESFEHIEDESQKNPEEMAVEDDVRDILLDIINGLPQDQRIAVHLYYYQDMTVKEISQIFGCSEQTTRNRLGYARKNIKKEVDKLEDKGIQLRSITLLPFLYLVFQAEESYAQVSVPAYSTLALAKESATAATASTTTTAGVATTTTAATGAKTAIFGLSMKAVIAAVVAIVVVVVGVVVAILPKDDNSDKNNRTEASSDDKSGNENNNNNASDDSDDANINTDADAAWGKVVKNEKIDLSHTFLGYHKDSHMLYEYYESNTAEENGDYYIIPLNDKYDLFETPRYSEEGEGYYNEYVYTEPGELHFEYDESSPYHTLTGPVYVVKKDTASDVVANKEYLTPAANIDLGEILINGQTLKLPCKASSIADINYMESNMGESLFITNGTMIEKYPGAYTYTNSDSVEYFNIKDSQIIMDPGEILVVSGTYIYSQVLEDNSNQSGLTQVNYILYNDTDTPANIADCTIYGVNTFLNHATCLDTANVWPQVCLPGYVSHAASGEYAMKQYGTPLANKNISEFDMMFEGDKYGCLLGCKVDVETNMQYSNITYFTIKEEIKEFIQDNFD